MSNTFRSPLVLLKMTSFVEVSLVAGFVDDLEQYLGEANRKPNMVSHSAVISAGAKAKDIRRTFDVCEDMLRPGACPAVVCVDTYYRHYPNRHCVRSCFGLPGGRPPRAPYRVAPPCDQVASGLQGGLVGDVGPAFGKLGG